MIYFYTAKETDAKELSVRQREGVSEMSKSSNEGLARLVYDCL